MNINSFNEPTKHPFDTFGKVEIESFMWWFFSQCYKKQDLDAEIETTHNHDHLIGKGFLHKVADKKYRLTKGSKAKLYSFYGKD
jgi:hypothetical protein